MAALGASPRIVVVGAGILGLWTARQLQLRGAEVTLVDARGPGNDLGSSGDSTRIWRTVYGGDRLYQELAQRAKPAWLALDSSTSTPLFRPTGVLWLLRAEGEKYLGRARAVGIEEATRLEELSLPEARRRWPALDLSDVSRVVFEPEAGVLAARDCCLQLFAQLEAAGGRYHQASVQPGAWVRGRLREVVERDGTALSADAFVFACGPWLGSLFPRILGPYLRVTRQDVFYFELPTGAAGEDLAELPVWCDFGAEFLYGMVDPAGGGFKIASDRRGSSIDPDTDPRTVTAEDVSAVRRVLARRFPGLAKAPFVRSKVCVYTNSPDGHLVVDRHPEADNVWLLGAGSGHAFKLAPTLGELVAAAILEGADLPKSCSVGRFVTTEADRMTTQFER